VIATTSTATSTIHPRLASDVVEILFTRWPFDARAIRSPSAPSAIVPYDSTVLISTAQETRAYTAALRAAPGQAGEDEIVDKSLHRATGGRLPGDDGSEDQIPGQQVPEFVGDGGFGDLAPVDGQLQYVLD